MTSGFIHSTISHAIHMLLFTIGSFHTFFFRRHDKRTQIKLLWLKKHQLQQSFNISKSLNGYRPVQAYFVCVAFQVCTVSKPKAVPSILSKFIFCHHLRNQNESFSILSLQNIPYFGSGLFQRLEI